MISLTNATRSSTKFGLFLLVVLWLSPAWAVPVTVATVQESTWKRTISVMGQVKSVGTVTLTAPMTGRVVGPFPPTGMLAAGTIIAHIHAPGLQARLQAAQAQVDYARKALQRNRLLLKDGVVARATVEASLAGYKQAIGNAKALQAEQDELSLTAPFAGIISYLVAPGTVVAAGTPIASLSGRAQPWVQALVSPQIALRLHKGAPAVLREHNWQGNAQIHSIGTSARRSGLVSVIIRLPKRTPVLPGEWLSVQLQTENAQVLTVPIAAVVMHGADSLVYIDRHGHALPISIQVLGTEHDVARITGDLKPGEKIVLSGNTRISKQTPLEVRK